MAGVKFLVLGEGETCTGDSARRSGNEFLFQLLAAQNVEMLNDCSNVHGWTARSSSPARTVSTPGSEYPQVGGNYEVVHHTQLLNQLPGKKLKPLTPVDRSAD